jgi:hypothetical protein
MIIYLQTESLFQRIKVTNVDLNKLLQENSKLT